MSLGLLRRMRRPAPQSWLAYVTARYATVAPFGKVATLLSGLLPMSGAQNAGTIRNRTLRVGESIMRRHSAETAKRIAVPPASPGRSWA